MSYNIKFNLGNKTNQISITIPIKYRISFDFVKYLSWNPHMILVIMNYYICNVKSYICPINIWCGSNSIIRDNFIQGGDIGELINVLKSNHLTFKSEDNMHLMQYKNNTWTHELWTYNENTDESTQNGKIKLELDDMSRAQFAKALSEYLILEQQFIHKIELMDSIRNYKK